MDQSEVRINTIHSAVGAINETDVVPPTLPTPSSSALASVPTARPAPPPSARASRSVATTSSTSASRDLDAARIGMLKPTEVEVSTGSATVLAPSRCPRSVSPPVSASKRGEIAATDSVRPVRDGIVVFNGKIASMRHYKDEAKSLKSGSEGGIGRELPGTSSPATPLRATASTGLPVPSRG